MNGLTLAIFGLVIGYSLWKWLEIDEELLKMDKEDEEDVR